MDTDLTRRKSVWNKVFLCVARIDSRCIDIATDSSDIDTIQSSKNETLCDIDIKLHSIDGKSVDNRRARCPNSSSDLDTGSLVSDTPVNLSRHNQLDELRFFMNFQINGKLFRVGDNLDFNPGRR